MTEDSPAYGDADRVTIRRTGLPPLRLEGFQRVALVTTKLAHQSLRERWHEIELWRDKRAAPGPEQRHCIVVRWRSSWQHEHEHDRAEVVRRADVADRLERIDPLEHLVGYPEGEQFERRQRTLEKDLALAWHVALSEAFEQARIYDEVTASSSTAAPASARLSKVMSDLMHQASGMLTDTAPEELRTRAALDLAVRRIVELEDLVAASIGKPDRNL